MNSFKSNIATTVVVLLMSNASNAALLYYDGMDGNSTYVNTSNNVAGLHYTYPGGLGTMPVSGGKRVNGGSGDSGNDIIELDPGVGDAWDQAGLYHSGTDTIGGGDVEGVLYISFLIRAHEEGNSVSENKDGQLPDGRYCGFGIYKGSTSILEMGNHWNAWAYSVYGNGPGNQDLKDESLANGTWITVNRDIHLMVARIAFHADAADDIAVWLDPVPEDGDNQGYYVRRYIATTKGDFSFDRVSYRSGNIPNINATDFDEVRFGTSWTDVTPGRRPQAFWYDSQSAASVFTNTIFSSSGLHYKTANGEYLKVENGKRITTGVRSNGTDVISLSLGSGTIWDAIGLYDSGSGRIGGGEISGTLYMSALIRSQNTLNSTLTEKKSGGAPYGTEAFVGVTRTGLSDTRGVLGLGNGFDPHAYSIGSVNFDVADLIKTNGVWTYYNTDVRMMVAKFTFKHNASDSVTVWLDPNPDHGDNQSWDVCKNTRSGDFSFDQVFYTSGDLGDFSKWEFDEVRFGTDWPSVTPIHYGTLILIL